MWNYKKILFKSFYVILEGGVNMKKIFKSMDRVLVGGIAVLCSISLGFIYWLQPNSKNNIPIWILVLLVIFFFILVILVYAVTRYIYENKSTDFVFPRIITINQDSKKNIRVIQTYNDLYTQDCWVGLYYQEPGEEIEVFIGVGFVEVVKTTSGYTQILIKKINFEKEEVTNAVELLLKNSKKARQSLKIRPNVNTDYLTIVEDIYE